MFKYFKPDFYKIILEEDEKKTSKSKNKTKTKGKKLNKKITLKRSNSTGGNKNRKTIKKHKKKLLTRKRK
jgi:hypothetical protein